MISHEYLQMTIAAFLAALEALRPAGYRPYVAAESYGPAIRLESPAGHEHCPITAVCAHRTGKIFPPVAVYSTLESLGLSPDDAYALSAAADLQAAEPLLRHQLLTALALREGPEPPGAGPSTPNQP
jgi:hypothetical protein